MSKVRVNNRKVCCHGDENDEGSGHPLIYLDMGEEEEIACPYCEKTFVHDCTVEAVGELTRLRGQNFRKAIQELQQD